MLEMVLCSLDKVYSDTSVALIYSNEFFELVLGCFVIGNLLHVLQIYENSSILQTKMLQIKQNELQASSLQNGANCYF